MGVTHARTLGRLLARHNMSHDLVSTRKISERPMCLPPAGRGVVLDGRRPVGRQERIYTYANRFCSVLGFGERKARVSVHHCCTFFGVSLFAFGLLVYCLRHHSTRIRFFHSPVRHAQGSGFRTSSVPHVSSWGFFLVCVRQRIRTSAAIIIFLCSLRRSWC